MKLAICTPHARDDVKRSWIHRLKCELEYPVNTEFIYTCSIPVEAARNELVSKSYEIGATHILFIDDDVWPLSDGSITSLIKSDKDIIGGLCKYRTPKDKWVICPQILQDGDGIVEVLETGMGFIMIKMTVFETLAGSLPFNEVEFFKWAGSTRKPSGEDISFCRMAKKFGYKIYVDRNIRCGHHDTVIFDNTDEGFTQIRKGFKPGNSVEKIEWGQFKNGKYKNDL